MITGNFDDSDLMKKFTRTIEYSMGFFEGVELGKDNMLDSLGKYITVTLGDYVDSSASINPQQLQHVYEWGETGNESGRLFDIDYVVSKSSIQIMYNFRQSSSIKPGSNVPFYNKAQIMEQGIPVTIAPKRSRVLVFEQDGETIFTSKPVVVPDPGGAYAQNGFKMTLDEFLRTFSQTFLTSTGIAKYLSNLDGYKRNFNSGGRIVGRSAGYKWISKAGGVL